MKNIHEKEKKLTETLKKLRKINIQDNKEIDEIAILKDQKNQLEIEKNQINKFIESLEQENLKLKNQVNELKKDYEISKRKENQFTEKIDELNQETDSLLEELDKWQM
jgi:chromosome segregation ATPase